MIAMEGLTRWIRSNWDAVTAFVLAFTAIAIVLGPGWFFLTWYFAGCAYLIYLCLKRPS